MFPFLPGVTRLMDMLNLDKKDPPTTNGALVAATKAFLAAPGDGEDVAAMEERKVAKEHLQQAIQVGC